MQVQPRHILAEGVPIASLRRTTYRSTEGRTREAPLHAAIPGTVFHSSSVLRVPGWISGALTGSTEQRVFGQLRTLKHVLNPEPFLWLPFPIVSTVQALLINSANLMNGSSEPDGFRGFGRIHLEQGMPLDGQGSLVLFVADAANTSIPELTKQKYLFNVDSGAGLDFRVTLSWIDPGATSLSVKQLVHDLNLAVFSPSGTRYTMWKSGKADNANVNERVIVDAGDVESGTWSVWVAAKALTTDVQSYSLVVNGAISPVTQG